MWAYQYSTLQFDASPWRMHQCGTFHGKEFYLSQRVTRGNSLGQRSSDTLFTNGADGDE